MSRNHSQYQVDFFQRLKDLRESANFTQLEFAKALGLPRDTYAKYETRSLLPHDLIPDVARLCNVDVEFILTGVNGKSALKPIVPDQLSATFEMMLSVASRSDVPFDDNPRMFLLAAAQLAKVYAEDEFEFTPQKFCVSLETLFRAYNEEFRMADHEDPNIQTAKTVVRLSQAHDRQAL